MTMYNAEGWWTDDTGNPVKDVLTVLECIIPVWSGTTLEWWLDLADALRIEWKQDCIMMSVHPSTAYLVREKD